jgi:hypothetical protein
MATALVFDQNVNAPIAQYDIAGGGGTGQELMQIAIQMRTNTPESAPGQGVLLCSMTFFDGDITDTLNISLNLSAGNVSKMVFPAFWHDFTGPITLAFSYIGPGGADGDADVKILFIDL